jgi:hypothetical protein
MRSMKDVAVFLSIGTLVSLTSCQRASSPSAQYVHPGPPRYEIECTVSAACDESVALLVGLSAPEEPMRCTAALIGKRAAITAGHCVASELSTGGTCHGVWLGFAGGEGRSAEWVGCRRIASVMTSSPALLSPDYAIVELAREVDRAPYPIAREPVSSGQVVRMVSVTADRFYDRLHQVRSRRCVVDENGSLAPWSPHAPPSIRVLSSCPVGAGSSGAPVLDHEGRMRGLIHGGGPRYFAFGLMTPLPEPVDREDG